MARRRPGSALIALTILLAALPAANAAGLRVVDGDTLTINGTTYRLHGIDAPEAGQTCARPGGGVWPCGREAIRALERLADPLTIACDDRGGDAFGRTLSVCHAGGREINRALVERGLAWAFRRYADDYADAEGRAQADGRGIWQATTEPAWIFRQRRWTKARNDQGSNCPIKGNVSESGRIYHVPWSPWYEKTSVNAKRGERWFCSEDEAIAAGWRAPAWGAGR